MKVYPLISYIEAYVVLNDKEKALLLSAYKPHVLKKKELLYKQGEQCKTEAFVISGTLRVFYTDDKGHEHILNFALPGWWVGDIASFYDGTLAFASVQALEPTELLVIDPESKAELFEKIPKLERVFRIILQKHLASLQKRFLTSMSETADVRYGNLLEKIPAIEQLVPQHMIASYLGILPESLSRLKKQLIEQQK